MSSNNHISQHQKVTGLLGEKMELPMVTVVSIVQDRARSREIARDRAPMRRGRCAGHVDGHVDVVGALSRVVHVGAGAVRGERYADVRVGAAGASPCTAADPYRVV